MRNRVFWIIGSVVMGVLLLLFLPSAMAQQNQDGEHGVQIQRGSQTNQSELGQQGEFEGEHFDGALFDAEHDDGALLDGEHNDGAFSEGEHNDGAFSDGKHNDGNIEKNTEHGERTSVDVSKGHDLNIEQMLDLQEIKGTELTEAR